LAHKISPESFDGVYPPLELFSLKEKVTLLPGGLFVCGIKKKSSQLPICVRAFVFFQALTGHLQKPRTA
jgi:hypothetical protein